MSTANLPAAEEARPRELLRSALDHLDRGHWPTPAEVSEVQYLHAAAPQGSLPYSLLEPKAFERLCFHLLLASTGKSVRFWGRSGQAQQGIDLLLSDGLASTVYQCKHTASFGAADLRAALEKFRAEWLGRPELGRPQRFVLCTSALSTDTVDWEAAKREAAQAMGVAVEEWHRDTLNAALRTQPGIVAELFGDRVALAFCGPAAAAGQDVFRPLHPGADPRVDRFFQLHDAGWLAPLEVDLQTWRSVLERHGALMLGGMAGTGKTIAALAMAVHLQRTGWRAYFLRADASHDVDALAAGLLARAFRPTVFVIDDCHKALDAVERLLYRIRPSSTHLHILLTGRSAPTDADLLSPNSTAWVERLQQQGQLFTLAVDAQRALAVMRARDPAWNSRAGERLLAWSGHDLAVLDLLLATVSPGDLGAADALRSLFPRLLQEFFGGAKTASAPRLRQLAAIAQFDIDVPVDLFPDPLETGRNALAIERLVLAVGRPRCLAFSHPSAAELVYALLCWAQAEADPVATAAADCVEVLNRAIEQFEPAVWCDAMLGGLLRTRLKLSDDHRLKQRVLNAPEVMEAVCGLPIRLSQVRFQALSSAAFLSRGTPAAGRYAAGLSLAIEAYVQAVEPTTGRGLPLSPVFLRTLSLSDVGASLAMEARIGSVAMAQAITARGSVNELLLFLRYFSPDFAARLLRDFPPEAIAELVDRTLGLEDKWIGPLNLSLRDLKGVTVPGEAGQTLLTLFEARVGAPAMARLIARRGSVVELLRGLPQLSPDFAARLLREFPPEAMAELVDRTLGLKDKSIGTLNLTLRDLKGVAVPGEAGQTLLTLFEARVGAPAMARLIARRGSVVELLKGLPQFSPDFTARLLREFPPEAMAELVDRTLGMEDKSIGTLDLSLRELKGVAVPGETGQTLLTLFEARVGAPAMARLIARRGSVVELLLFLRYFSPDFAARLLRDFPPETMAELVDRTLGLEDKSIGTLNLSLRDLKGVAVPGEAGQTLLTLFEAQLGPSAFWRWMQVAGNLHHMKYLVAELTPAFRALAFGQDHLPPVSSWEAVARRGSIYSLANFAAEALHLLPAACRRPIEQVASTLAPELTREATWQEIGATQGQLDRMATGDPLHGILGDAIQARVSGVDVAATLCQGFEDACSSLQALWRAREDLRAKIGQRLWQWLPDESTWPLDYKRLLFGRFALTVARTPLVSDGDAHRVLRAFAPLSDRVAIDPKAARQHALFLWNLQALWFERGQAWAASFEALQPTATWQRFANVVRQRATWRDNQQKLDTLMLAGALATWLPSLRGDLQATLRGQLKGATYLLDLLDQRNLPFIPMLLTSQGLALLMPASSVYPPGRVERLLARLDDHPEQGPALNEVRRELLGARGVQVARGSANRLASTRLVAGRRLRPSAR